MSVLMVNKNGDVHADGKQAENGDVHADGKQAASKQADYGRHRDPWFVAPSEIDC